MALPAGGSAVADFELKTPVTTAKTAVVKVDPDNAVKETNEDNNSATFTLAPAVEQPDLTISKVDTTGNIVVTITNAGGALPASTVTVKVTVGGNGSEQSKNIALANGQSSDFTVTKPGTGAGKVEVFLAGQVVKTKEITVP